MYIASHTPAGTDLGSTGTELEKHISYIERDTRELLWWGKVAEVV